MICAVDVPTITVKMPRINRINEGIRWNKSHEFSIDLIEKEVAVLLHYQPAKRSICSACLSEKKFPLAVNRRVEMILNGLALMNVTSSDGLLCEVCGYCWYKNIQNNTQIDSTLWYENLFFFLWKRNTWNGLQPHNFWSHQKFNV